MGELAAVVFDFDGLICDTEGCYYSATAEVYRLHGVELTMQEWADTVGWADHDDWIAHLAGVLGHDLDRDELLALRRDLDASCRRHLTPRPGVVALMADVRHEGLRVGVASNSSKPWINEHLEQFGITAMVDVLVGGDVVTARKPAPDVYLAVVAELEVDAAEAIALEDSRPGMLAAKAAGLVCVAVPNDITRLTDLSEADEVLDTLEGVTVADLERLAKANTPTP